MARADERRSTVRVMLESDQQQAIQSEGREISRLTVRHHGEAREYLVHLRTIVDGVLNSSGISDIHGPCASWTALHLCLPRYQL